jgi:excisionase family DNA binding protein
MQRYAGKQTVARLLGVHDATVMRWVRQGRLPPPFTLVPRGRVFFDLEKIETFLAAKSYEGDTELKVAGQ